jgi:hypothetical protein
MKVETMVEDKLAGITYQIPTPDGNMFVTVSEDIDGKPIAIWIHIGKAGSAVGAWSNAVARLMTVALDHGATINDLMTELSSQTSDKRRETSDGEVVRSGIEGVWVALMKYKRSKFEAVSQSLGDVDGRGRGPRLGR